MMRRLFIVENEKQIPHIAPEDIALALNKDVYQKMEGLRRKKPSGYGVMFDWSVGKDALGTVREWGKIKVGSETLSGYLNFKGMPYWDAIESNICLRIFESSKKLQTIKVVKAAIEEESPDVAVALPTPEGKAALSVARHSGIRAVGMSGRRKLPFRDAFFRYANMLKSARNGISPSKSFAEGKKKILVVPTIETETSVVAPVLESLDKRKDVDMIVLALPSLRDRMRKSLDAAGIESFNIEAYATKESREREREAGEFLSARWKVIENSALKEKMLYGGTKAWDAVKDDLEFYFSSRKRIFEIVSFVETLREIIIGETPDMILALDELSELGKPMSILAKQYRTPLLIIQHGLFSEGTFIYGPSLASRKCVWGASTRKMLLARGFSPSQVVVTGCPKFDALSKRKFRSRISVSRDLSIDTKKGIVLFASQPVPNIEKAARIVFSAVKRLPEKQLVVKLHPRERSEAMYESLSKEFDIPAKVVREYDLYSLLSNCDFLVTPYSTVDVEGLALGKPLINVPIGKGGAFEDALHAPKAGSAEELISIMRSFESPGTAKALRKESEKAILGLIYKLDGKATERIVSVAESLMKKKAFKK